MSKKTWLILVVILVVFLGYGLSAYNLLVTGRETVDKQWAQVETQYQRRVDLIPNLVNSVKGAMNQEQAIFTALAEARANYAGATTVNDKAAAATEIETGLGRLLAVMENYPQLKSVDTVQTLMSQLEGTENRVSVERKRFNDEVQNYNLRVKRFPSKVFAAFFGFDEQNYFEAAAGSEKAPSVEL